MGGFFGGSGSGVPFNAAWAIVDADGTVQSSFNVAAVIKQDIGDYVVQFSPGVFSVDPAASAQIRATPVTTAGINTTRVDANTGAAHVLTVNGGTGAVGDQAFMVIALGVP